MKIGKYLEGKIVSVTMPNDDIEKGKKEIEELEKNKKEKIKEKAKITLEQYKSSFEENLYKDAQNIIDEAELDDERKIKEIKKEGRDVIF